MLKSSALFRSGRVATLGLVGALAVSVLGGAVLSRPSLVRAADDSVLVVSASLAFLSDNDDNGMVNVGDQIRVNVVVNNTDGGCGTVPGAAVTADVRAYGGAETAGLTCVTDNSGVADVWQLDMLVSDAGVNGIDVGGLNELSAVTVSATDGDEDIPSLPDTTPMEQAVDTIAPTVQAADVSLDKTGCSGYESDDSVWCIVGDTLLVTWNAAEDNAGESMGSAPGDVTVDLSNLGGAVYAVMYDSGEDGDAEEGDNVWTISYTIPAGEIDAELNLTIPGMTVIDNAGNLRTCGELADTADIDDVAPAAPTIDTVAAIASNNEINADERAETVVVTGSNEAFSPVTLDGNPTSGDTPTNWSYILDAEAIDAFGQGPQTLTAVAYDSSGNSAQVTRDINVDTVLPTLDASSPAEDERSVSRDADLVLTFSEPLREEFSEGTQFNVTPDAGDWTAEADEDGVITLSHSERLDCGTDYTVDLDMGTMSDGAGNYLDGEGSAVSNSYTFRTKGCGSSTPVSSSTGSTTTETEEAVTDETATTDETESTDATEAETEAETSTDSQGRTWAPQSSSSGSSPYDGSIQPISVVEDGQFIRGEHYSSVYYVGADQVRHPFWDAQSFFTYADSWSDVTWVTDATLATLELGTPMLPKPGVVLVKIQSDPKVYAVETGADGASNLRWVPSEEVAAALYGSTWADYVIDVEPTTMHWYGAGDDMTSSTTVDRTIMKTRMAIAMLAMGM